MRTDDYAWMKDEAWQQVLRDPKVLRADVREHLDAENAYTKAMLAGTEALQAQMFAEMKGRIKEDDSSVPAPDGPWDYYVRYETGAQHPIHARRPKGQSGGEHVLLDEEAASKGKAFFQTGAASHSPDHTLYAWAADEQGSEYYTIRVKDLASGQELGAPVESAYGDLAFSRPTASGCSGSGATRTPGRQRSSAAGSPDKDWGGDDALVYEEADEGMFLGIGDDLRRQPPGHPRRQPGRPPRSSLIPAVGPNRRPPSSPSRGRSGVKYSLDHWTDRWLIRTNADGAVDFKLSTSEAAIPTKATSATGSPTSPAATRSLASRLSPAISSAPSGSTRSTASSSRDRNGGEHEVSFDEEAYALNLEGGYEYETETARFVYQSPTTPRQTFDYNLATRDRTLRKTQEIPSGHDPARYVARRLYAKAAYGAEVPITVLMLKDTLLDGSAPLLLLWLRLLRHGHGPQASRSGISAFVDRGWIWATAHVRGGSDKGWGWFLDGRKEKKPNTFTDFIACAEHLIAAGYATKGRIAAYAAARLAAC